jgi:hypothetical protein
MEVSTEMFAAVCAVGGSAVTGFISIVYWIVKMRKDIDAAHVLIRAMKAQTVRKPKGSV